MNISINLNYKDVVDLLKVECGCSDSSAAQLLPTYGQPKIYSFNPVAGTSRFTMPTIIGKVVIMIFRAAAFVKPVSGTPGNSEMQVIGIPDKNGDGVLSTTGEIVLEAGDIFFSNEKINVIVYE